MTIETRKVDVKIMNGETVVFQKDQFEIPVDWSDRAATIVASKYAMDDEFSAVAIIDRVVDQISQWGYDQNYFRTTEKPNETQTKFEESLRDILLDQRAAFNSPVWFNCGSDSANKQMSACFIIPVEDTMESILEHNTIEGNIFKGGSGAGCNVSSIRGKGEKLSNKGEASGPISFMKMWDSTAGVIKSGGKTRRSAKMICMDVDHPDIMDFIECKGKEEDKANTLINSGVSAEEAYATVAFQNTNHSIRVSDKFMDNVKNEGEAEANWTLVNRGNSEGTKISSNRILNRTADVAWSTGDPGIQYDDAMNRDNPVASVGRINSTNPCLTADMEIMTSEGYIPIGELVGKEVKLINKDARQTTGKVWSNGKKDICKVKFHWKSGLETLKCTPDHRWMLIDGSECEAKDLKGKRLMPQEPAFPMGGELPVNTDSFLAGFIQGDGNPQRLNSDSHKGIEVYFGKDDKDVASMYDQPVGTWYSQQAAEIAKEFNIKQVSLSERTLPSFIIDDKRTKEKTDFLSGLFSANGCVIKDTRIAFKTTCKDLAKELKTILRDEYDIESYITTNKAHNVVFKNGPYRCKESYDLNIYKYTDIIRFYHAFWFAQEYKRKALIKTIIKRSPTVTAVKDAGNEEVFDFNEPSTHWGLVNGFVCHNCSEFCAVDNSSCNLASLNLVKYILEDDIDIESFTKDIEVLITAMDILVDAADYPTEEIRDMTSKTRPLGLGFSNLGAMLMLLGIPYDSGKGRELAADITRTMTTAAYTQSIELAKRLGSFEHFEENKKDNVKIASRLTEDTNIGTSISKHGLRNSQVTLLAPTGTISFMMDCDTTGIEPLFALKTIKQLAGGGILDIDYPCVEKAINLYSDSTGAIENKLFETANEIPWKGHIDMMAVCQKHLNGAISKTVNLPADATAADIKETYKYAWESGLKCIAIYRDGCKTLQPMTDANKKEEVEKETEEVEVEEWSAFRRRLPESRHSMTHKFNVGGLEGYLTVGMYEDGNPGEIFIRAQKQGSTMDGIFDAFATSVSMALQYGVPIGTLVEKFKGYKFEPSGFTQNEDIRFTSSVVDYLFRWLEAQFIDEEDDAQYEIEAPTTASVAPTPPPVASYDGPPCANCGSMTSRNGTCYVCTACGETTGCS